MQIDFSRYRVKLAETEVERLGAQRLRYRVFVEELGARANPAEHASRREWDAFDPWFDHLILLDLAAPGTDPLDRVVGAYRLLRDDVASKGPGHYGAREFDFAQLAASGRRRVELGRSCVAAEHRGGVAMHLLWSGLANYVLAEQVELLFGVASFSGIDPEPIAEALSYLHHRHLAPPDLRVRARAENRIEMDRLPLAQIDPLRALRAVPPLIKAYLRLGGWVGEGASVDVKFNTIDVCVVMDTARMALGRREFYARTPMRGIGA